MLFKIRHKIIYQYSEPVFIDPMEVRLKPREDVTQKVLDFQLTVVPKPQGQSEGIELDGSPGQFIWFQGQHERLELLAYSEIRTCRKDPFDFILFGEGSHKLPLEYPADLSEALKPYLKSQHDYLKAEPWLQEVLKKSGGETLAFLSELTLAINGFTQKVKRPEENLWDPREVLEKNAGACRDLAFLFMECCRALGIASRYVSGYTEGDPEVADRELHAWAEVYLPGGGWRGFDPTLGLAVADNHVSLVASAQPELTLPTQGTYRGTGIKSTMSYEVRMERSE